MPMHSTDENASLDNPKGHAVAFCIFVCPTVQSHTNEIFLFISVQFS